MLAISSPLAPESAAPSGFVWTDARVEQLMALWAAGKSANSIAIELGTRSRSAVLGKVHRLGLSGRRGLTPKPGHPATVARNPMRKVAPAKPPTPPKPEPLPAPRIVVEPPPGGIPFMATKRFHCRYAVAGDGMDMTCCGAVTVQGSYCDRHAGLIYAGRQTWEEARIETELKRRGAA